VTPPAIPGSASPSLASAGDGAGAAYELKFLLNEDRAAAVEAWARRRLALDPHGDTALGGAYRTTTLYCDTGAWHVYLRAPSYRRRKFRLRRYGDEALVYLERKSRRGDRVAKVRTPIRAAEVDLLAAEPEEDWAGWWFGKQLAARDLRPAALLAYERVALVGRSEGVDVRLTFDRALRGVPTGDWALAAVNAGRPFLAGYTIVEMKYRTALPALFKELVALFRLEPSSVSKYRRCLDSWGVLPGMAG
jgi:hypothetical protein